MTARVAFDGADLQSPRQPGRILSRRSSSPLLFTVAEAADTLGIGRSTLYAAIKSGSCPLTVTRIGKQIRIPRAALERLARDWESSDRPAHDDHAFLRELLPDLWPIFVEQPADELGSLLVLLGHGVCVVAGHVDRRPAEAGLLLAFGDDRVKDGGLEVTKRVQVDVTCHLGPISHARKGVAHHIWIGRRRTPGLEGEDEALVGQLGVAHGGELALFVPESGEDLDRAGVDAEPANTRSGLRALHDGARHARRRSTRRS